MNTFFVFTITGCISLSSFASLIGVPRGITSSKFVHKLKICAIAAGIKKYKSIIKKKKTNPDKVTFLSKSKLNKVEAFISKALIDSNVSHHEFSLINNVLQEDDEMEEEIKNSKT